MTTAIGQPEARAETGRKVMFDRYLVANLSLWVLTYLLITMRVVVGMDTPLPKVLDMSVRRAGVCLAASLFCVMIQKVLLASRDRPIAVRIAMAAGLSISGAIFWSLANQVAFYVILPIAFMEGSRSEFLWAVLPNISVLIWSFIAWCAVVFAIDYDQAAREQTMRLMEAQALAAESQNQMLRYQINPHFLFNTLNALSSLILQKDFVRAERMVLSLSNFLRASLERAPGEKITLADEVAAQRQYLAIEQERFGDRLRLAEATPALLHEALVPGLILQPLIENAVKYGVARTNRPVLVEIVAEQRGENLVVTVQDDAVPDTAPRGARAPQALGVGLENVRRRLAVLYGAAGVLTVGPRAGGGWAATIELPLERRK